MKVAFKIAAGLVALVIVLFIGLSIYVSTLDADKYRPQLVQTLTDKLGRKVEMKGPIQFSLGSSGVTIAIHDASISNPAWASRPTLASMGKFEIGVSLLPLLTHTIVIKKLAIENADILLETNGSNQRNWDMAAPVSTTQPSPTSVSSKNVSPAATAAASSASPLASLSVGLLTITDSQMAMRGADGKVSVYSVEKMTLDMRDKGAVLDFSGSLRGTPVTAKIKTGMSDLLSKAAFPFDADLTYGGYHVTAQGKADLEHTNADITAYQVSIGKTTLKGSAAATWGGARPTLRGKLQSDHMDMADFKTGQASSTSSNTSAPEPKTAAGNGRMFSDAPLPLDGLNAADVDFDVAIDEFVMGQSAFKKVTAKMVLAAGNLILAPVKATIGTKPIEAQIKLEGAPSSAHLTIGLIADGVDLSELQKLGDMKPFMTGKASANIQLTGTGNSAHAIASNLGGVITITAEKGEILGGAASGISSALAAIFAPKGSDSAINCLAVRFVAHYGLLSDNGILIDSAASTVAGKGTISLVDENIHLILHAKTKLVDIGGLVPALAVGGTLSKPTYAVDAVGAVKSLVGNLVNGNMTLGNDGVPTLAAAPAGQNACVYTLDHPQSGSSSSAGVLSPTPVGQATQKIQNIGNSLVKGLFGQ